MKVPGFIKNLNKTYSIVIIPNNNDNVRTISLKAPWLKLALLTAVILLLILPVFFNASAETHDLEESNSSLTRQLQALSQTLMVQNQTLQQSNFQISSLKTSDESTRKKILDFTQLFADITNDYVSKSSRGTSSKSTSNAIEDIIKLSSLIEELNRTLNSENQQTEELNKTSESLRNFVDALPTYIPAKGQITSDFGTRIHPITRIRKKHNGVDIDAQKGDPIYSAGAGEVIYSGYSAGFGYNIVIDHKNGFKTTYAHCSKLIAKEGALVKKGQKIALVGSTGLSTGPHLHFEIKINDSVVDPQQYVEFK